MKFVRTFVSICAVLLAFPAVLAKQNEDAEQQALRDLQTGMAGLKAASQDPTLLAQLMHDLQDPEMMAEAKKMMDSPEFQKQMKKLTNDKEFKDSVKKSVDLMKDPSTAAEMEARLEHMVKVGEKEMKKGAAAAMEEAMASFSNPEVMAEMTRMMKDPNFQAQMAAVAKDPAFKNYVGAMEDMMKDPDKRQKMEAFKDSIRASL